MSCFFFPSVPFLLPYFILWDLERDWDIKCQCGHKMWSFVWEISSSNFSVMCLSKCKFLNWYKMNGTKSLAWRDLGRWSWLFHLLGTHTVLPSQEPEVLCKRSDFKNVLSSPLVKFIKYNALWVQLCFQNAGCDV